jgi:uncharacterized membrane protein
VRAAWVTAFLWLLFGGSHVLLSRRATRRRLIDRLGETGFIASYSAVAIVCFAALVHQVALHRDEGPKGWLLPSIPPVSGALVVVSLFGLALLLAGVLVYPQLPMAAFGHRALEPQGIQQVTRHPFFAGIALWAGAHCLLSVHPVSFVFFLGFLLLALIGGLHQDRRLLAELGEPYRAYLARTSWLPFLAVLRGKQKLRWREQPWWAYALGLACSLVIRQLHAHLFDFGGLWIVLGFALGSIAAMLSSRAKRRSR